MISALVATVSGEKLPIGEAGLNAVLGYAVVFIGLVMLMLVVMLVGKIMVAKDKKAAAAEPASPVEAPAEPVCTEKAPGSAGGVKLYNVSERDAAMIMAIVADTTGKPLNELRFISIKEVE